MRGLPLVAASGGHSSSWCAGLSLSRPLLLRSTGSRRVGSVAVAHGPSCSAACGIFPDQGSNPCPLHWQADSQPLCHQGSPRLTFCVVQLYGFWQMHNVMCPLIQYPSDSSAAPRYPMLPPYPWHLLIFLTLSVVLPVPECHIVGITQYVDFSDCLPLLRNVYLRFLHLFLWLVSTFLFIA